MRYACLYKRAASEEAAALSFLCRSVEHGDEEGQQDERRRDPLGQAGELGVERGRLTLAEIVVGIAGERAETVLLAGLEQDDRSQSNAGEELQNEKNDL